MTQVIKTNCRRGCNDGCGIVVETPLPVSVTRV